ncbi:MAG: serine/threonine protein kinase, partial [Myxococcales bacterium]|nr:serine/threonine protein kinase [Myxococcales bacterium]
MSRYELCERLGGDGTIEVWRGRAFGVEGFEKSVAIKRLVPRLAGDERRARRLLVEAHLLATLSHRGIVQPYDVGVGEDGERVVVLEYVDGCDLGTLLARMNDASVPFPHAAAVHLVTALCDALEHLHRGGAAGRAGGRRRRFVHRAVSPANVLVARTGEVKLTGFGAARPVGAVGAAGAHAYRSPEQTRGEAQDARSDLYALGMIFAELVGRGRAGATAGGELVEGHQRDAELLDAGLPPAVEQLLQRMLAPTPAARPASAAEIAGLLREHRHEGTSSAPEAAQTLAALVDRFAPRSAPEQEVTQQLRFESVVARAPRSADATHVAAVDVRALFAATDDADAGSEIDTTRQA